MQPRDITELVLLFAATALVLFNIYMIRTYGPQASISHVIGGIGSAPQEVKRVIFLAFLFGLLCGHWFWNL